MGAMLSPSAAWIASLSHPESGGAWSTWLGLAYADSGQVEKVIGLLEQALRIGQEIKDPRIIQIATAQLERLRDGGEN